MIYFSQRQSDGLIKIGCSRYLSNRLYTIEKEHGTLALLAVMPGHFKEERAIHRRFSRSHRGGEWFNPTRSLVAFIEKHGETWNGENELQRGRMVRIRQVFLRQLKALSERNGTPLAEEVNRAIRELLERERLWPVASAS